MMTTEQLLELDGLQRLFPDFELGPLSMAFRSGHIYGLLGPNGAGKTTLLNLITLQLKPTAGLSLTRGTPIRWGDQGWKRRFSYIGETPSFYDDLTVAQTLELASRLYGQWDQVLADRLVDQFRLPSSRRVGLLSKGTRVKLGIVAALAHRAEMLILDEPTAGLDPTARADLQTSLKTLAAEHQTLCVVLSSHIFEDIEETATDVCILRGGRLAFQASAETLKAAVLYRSTASHTVTGSRSLVARWTHRGTSWVLVSRGSDLDRDLTARTDCVEEHHTSILGALYHGTEHLDVD